MLMDNHSAHISKEARTYLAGMPESFCGKMAKTVQRGIHVNSKAELQARIELFLKEVNEEPVIFNCKYKLEELNTEAHGGVGHPGVNPVVDMIVWNQSTSASDQRPKDDNFSAHGYHELCR